MRLKMHFHPIIWFSLDIVNVFLQIAFEVYFPSSLAIIVYIPLRSPVLREIGVENRHEYIMFLTGEIFFDRRC
jgi:hypothetical protein